MQQEEALELLKTGANVFITGSAGTGKTYLLNRYIEYLKERQVTPTIVAPTGIAASHLGGQTIHSFFGIGIRDVVFDDFINELLEKQYLKKRFNELEILIIDEISMVSPNLFSSLDSILQAFKRSSKPFGGVQVVVSGDFFQLPPVNATLESRFAWQSPSWRDLDFQSCYLAQKFRQSDEQMIALLDAIRHGKVDEQVVQKLQACQNRELGQNPTRLYTHNIDVDRINAQELAKIDRKPRTYHYSTKGVKKNVQKILNSSILVEELTLKKGAKVIFIKNSKEYFNGTTGEVIGFCAQSDSPIVQTTTGAQITVTLEEWTIENSEGEVIAKVVQFPLRLAWAMTIHKSQGMTLECVEIDLSKTFELGQGYVALSRIKTLEQLRLLGLNDLALRVDPLMLKVDKKIEEASKRAQERLDSLKEIKKLQREHIIACGGTNDEQIITHERKKMHQQPKERDDTPTHLKTKALLKKHQSITSIAKARELTEGTILTHLRKLKDEGVDIEKLRPNDESFATIIDSIKEIKPDYSNGEQINLKGIFAHLDKKVSYYEIRLALLFID